MESSTLLLPEAGLKDLKVIRHFLQDQMVGLGIDPEIVYDLLLAVTEAVTNIIEHGYGGHPGWIQLKVEQEEKDIHLILRDQAFTFDPTQIPVPDLSIPLGQRIPGGMGIHLIRQNVNHLCYRPVAGGGNELIMIWENIIP